MQMRDRGIKPDDATYRSVITAYGNAGQWEEAELTFFEMQNREVGANADTYAALLRVYAHNGQFERVLKAFRDARQRRLGTTALYNAFFEACEITGQYGKALEMYWDMRNASRSPRTARPGALVLR